MEYILIRVKRCLRGNAMWTALAVVLIALAVLETVGLCKAAAWADTNLGYKQLQR